MAAGVNNLKSFIILVYTPKTNMADVRTVFNLTQTLAIFKMAASALFLNF